MDVAVAAVALGANVIEKHFTLDKGMVGPDHAASLSPQELADYITKIREASLFLGDGAKRPQPSEMVNRPAMRRSLVATRDIREGTQLSEDLLIFKRPGTGISPEHLGFALGKRVNRNVAEDEVINWDDIG
jgi:sialic acid synthase SpsE